MADEQDGDIRSRLAAALEAAAEHLGELELPPSVFDHLERLSRQVWEPCAVAVVGRAKAGKSTFVNALLHEDLASVGATELTATITYFRYVPPGSAPEILLHWRDRPPMPAGQAAIEALQGHDRATLEAVAGLHHVEYRLSSPYLEKITLIDTPGIRAAVEEHGARTAEELGAAELVQELEQRHDRETRAFGREADAVLYLFNGAEPTAADLSFLDDLRALNAIGVMTQIDVDRERLEHREEDAAYLARKLKHNVNTVVPVSAGLRRAYDHLYADRAHLQRIVTFVRDTPPFRDQPAMLEAALDNQDVYLAPDLSPVSVDDRKALQGTMPWRVFTTVAGIAADRELDIEGVLARLIELSGFARLEALLEDRFLQRGRYLRGYRILREALEILEAVRTRHAVHIEEQRAARRAEIARLLAFIDRAASSDPDAAARLRELVRATEPGGGSIEEAVKVLDHRFTALRVELQAYNEDMEVLWEMQEHLDLFRPQEREELHRLLGGEGMELERRVPPDVPDEQLVKRSVAWRLESVRARDPLRRRVAERAERQYALARRERGRRARRPLS